MKGTMHVPSPASAYGTRNWYPVAGKRWLIVPLATLIVISGLLTPTAARAITAAQANLILQGFNVFTTQTFNGNGRTCGTCHIPGADYTISPADIAALTTPAHNVVLGGTNSALENPTLVDKFALFNINNDTPGLSGTGTTPAGGPFRASMQLSGLALTTLNACPNATLIATATTDSVPTAQITTVTPPLFPLVVGEEINIGGVSVGGNVNNFGGYNGLGVFVISSVINPTTFQYKKFGNAITGLSPGSGGAVTGLPGTGAGVCSTPPNFVQTFPPDTGTRFIELGWSGDGANIDPTLFTPAGTTDLNCKAAVDASNANPSNLTSVLMAFSMGAVRHHFARTNARVPGVDFRCPTLGPSGELSALAAFQMYLGRQFPSGTPLELALRAGTTFPGTQVSGSQPVITFKDATAETGKDIFLDPNAGCQFCHFNAGASLSANQVRTEPFGNPPLPFPGRNENEEQNVDLLTHSTFFIPSTGETVSGGLDGLTGITIGGTDPGDGSPIAGTQVFNGIPIFNVQSIIEAPRKKSFFHNGVFTTSVEDAASFYFTDAFAFNLNSAVFTAGTNQPGAPAATIAPGLPNPLPRGTGQPEANIPGGPNLALKTLAGIYFPSDSVAGNVLTSPGGQDVLNTMGFFLRALNVVYSLADCERLMSDASTLAGLDQPTTVQVLNCTTDLNDISRVIGGAQVRVPFQYTWAAAVARWTAGELREVEEEEEFQDQEEEFQDIRRTLQSMRNSIATITPDLPHTTHEKGGH